MHVSDPGTEWTVRDPLELGLRIRLRAVRMAASQGLGYLGQAAAGLALADRLHGSGSRLYAMVSDGEMEEGQLPGVVICRTSTRHGLDYLPPATGGHFIKLPPPFGSTSLYPNPTVVTLRPAWPSPSPQGHSHTTRPDRSQEDR
jgi:hypothetical protein